MLKSDESAWAYLSLYFFIQSETVYVSIVSILYEN